MVTGVFFSFHCFVPEIGLPLNKIYQLRASRLSLIFSILALFVVVIVVVVCCCVSTRVENHMCSNKKGGGEQIEIEILKSFSSQKKNSGKWKLGCPVE